MEMETDAMSAGGIIPWISVLISAVTLVAAVRVRVAAGRFSENLEQNPTYISIVNRLDSFRRTIKRLEPQLTAQTPERVSSSAVKQIILFSDALKQWCAKVDQKFTRRISDKGKELESLLRRAKDAELRGADEQDNEFERLSQDIVEVVVLATDSEIDPPKQKQGLQSLVKQLANAAGLELLDAQKGMEVDPIKHNVALESGRPQGTPTIGQVRSRGLLRNNVVVKPADVITRS
jgi:molecular chaperone GrpE (heat shock protein)